MKPLALLCLPLTLAVTLVLAPPAPELVTPTPSPTRAVMTALPTKPAKSTLTPTPTARMKPTGTPGPTITKPTPWATPGVEKRVYQYWLPWVSVIGSPVINIGLPPLTLPVCERDEQQDCVTPTLAEPPTETPPTAYP